MESRFTFLRVGNYSMRQGNPEDCAVCKNADFGDVIINDVCGKCLHHFKDSSVGLW